MTTTTLNAVPEIAIGANRIDGLVADVAALPGSPRAMLLVADPGLAAVGVTARVAGLLAAAGLEATLFDRLESNPTSAQIDDGVAVARRARAGAVVGIGGGSALDVAKLVAALAPGHVGAEDVQFCNNPLPAAPLPSICVPTTSGTGSEATTTSVFNNAAGKKAWAWGPELRAAKALLDPTLTTGLPAHLTAATGFDAFVHAVEACTNANRSGANDLFCHHAIRLIAGNLATAVRSPSDLAAREAMLVASCFAGIGINNAGTAMGHVVAHALGSLAKIHHGRAAGIGLCAALPWNLSVNTQAYAAVAAAMGGPRDAAALPGLIARLVQDCGLKLTVADELPGLTPEALAAEMARPENASMRRANARPSTDADLLAVARAVLA